MEADAHRACEFGKMIEPPRDPGGPLLALTLGILMIIRGGYNIITGEGGTISMWHVPLVDWIGWVLLPAGIIISIMSIRWLLRGGGKHKPKKYTDEDVTQAKATLDRMYFKEHGYWPKTDRKKDDS